ncbi:MAG: hypothetical protein AAFW83_10340 [Pseudomonadota bacterium]
MKSVQDYMDAAKSARNFKSDRELARNLGITCGPINQLRSGRTMPKDETMIAIAKLAGEDEQVALLRLNIWRAGSSRAGDHYKSILKLLTGMAAAIVLGLAPIGTIDTRTAPIDDNQSRVKQSVLFLIWRPQVRILSGTPMISIRYTDFELQIFQIILSKLPISNHKIA